jgi:hypothetical protein
MVFLGEEREVLLWSVHNGCIRRVVAAVLCEWFSNETLYLKKKVHIYTPVFNVSGDLGSRSVCIAVLTVAAASRGDGYEGGDTGTAVGRFDGRARRRVPI